MKIQQLSLENFKGFENRSFNFSDQFTLLIGENGTGKTAILDALAIGAGSLFLGFDEVPSRNILPDEIRVGRHKKGQTITENRQYPVSVTCEGIVIGKKINWTRQILSYEGRITRSLAREIMEISTQIQQQVRRGEDVLLPVIAYYGTSRLWLQKRKSQWNQCNPVRKC